MFEAEAELEATLALPRVFHEASRQTNSDIALQTSNLALCDTVLTIDPF